MNRFRMLAAELSGVPEGAKFAGFDEVCAETVKNVRNELLAVADAPAPDPVAWKSEEVLPSEKGWYAIMRSDGSFCIRGWGNGRWWIPLKDGWMSGLPTGFKWFGPLEPIEWDTPQPTLPKDWQAQHLRQYMHNDGSGLVFGYDKEGIDRMLAAAKETP